jgi:hypothetical protein
MYTALNHTPWPPNAASINTAKNALFTNFRGYITPPDKSYYYDKEVFNYGCQVIYLWLTEFAYSHSWCNQVKWNVDLTDDVSRMQLLRENSGGAGGGSVPKGFIESINATTRINTIDASTDFIQNELLMNPNIKETFKTRMRTPTQTGTRVGIVKDQFNAIKGIQHTVSSLPSITFEGEDAMTMLEYWYFFDNLSRITRCSTKVQPYFYDDSNEAAPLSSVAAAPSSSEEKSFIAHNQGNPASESRQRSRSKKRSDERIAEAAKEAAKAQINAEREKNKTCCSKVMEKMSDAGCIICGGGRSGGRKTMRSSSYEYKVRKRTRRVRKPKRKSNRTRRVRKSGRKKKTRRRSKK